MKRPLMRALRVSMAMAAVLAGASVPSLALADGEAPGPVVNTRTWLPPADPNAGLVVEPASTVGPGVVSVGALAHASLRPVTLFVPADANSPASQARLQHQFGMDIVANLGIGSRLALGAIVPAIVYQKSAGFRPGSEPVHSALGDVGLSLKATLVPNDTGGLGIATVAGLTLPTGHRASFVSDGVATGAARIIAEYTMLVASAQVSAGYIFKNNARSWPTSTTESVRISGQVPWHVGITLRPAVFGIDPGNRQRLEVAAHGSLPAGPEAPFGLGGSSSARLTPLLLSISDRVELGHYRDAYLLAGAEVGLLPSAIGVPDVRGIVGLGWARRNHDIDHDGIDDDIDGCPDIAEDRDGFEDSDGCPDPDNDDDGIVDRFDACPNEKGASSSDLARNGCPAPASNAATSETSMASQAPDSDHDGVPDARDACPTQAEDVDGVRDDDGCPDDDNDADGVTDREDACPNVAGVISRDPARNGCPLADRDGDTFRNDVDACPDEAESWNGVDDNAGCPDTAARGGAPLVSVAFPARPPGPAGSMQTASNRVPQLRLASPIDLVETASGTDVADQSMPTLRALATLLHQHPEWIVAVAVRPTNAGADPDAEIKAAMQSLAVVRVIGSLSQRDGVAETIRWSGTPASARPRVPGPNGASVAIALMNSAHP